MMARWRSRALPEGSSRFAPEPGVEGCAHLFDKTCRIGLGCRAEAHVFGGCVVRRETACSEHPVPKRERRAVIGHRFFQPGRVMPAVNAGGGKDEVERAGAQI